MGSIGEGWDLPKRVRDSIDFHWFKVKPGRPVVLGILSVVPVWYVGHFHQKRMRRCSGDGCELCALGIGGQVRYLFGCVEPATGILGVMEVGKSVGLQLRDWAARRGSMRGMLVEFCKATGAKRSHTELSYVEMEEAPVWLKHGAPDLKLVLERTWARQDTEEGSE
jgi:hypothetical protein